MTLALLWDIDGTLLSTARAGVGSLEDAAAAVLGRRVDLQEMHTAGLTDPEIARLILSAGGATDDASVDQFLNVYVARLPERLRDRRGSVMPNVVAILAAADERDDVVNALLTGNMRGGARAKLDSYGLGSFFPDPLLGGFGDDAPRRRDIAAAAVSRVSVGTGAAPDEMVVIGDTPADVECGRAHGLRTVAVATGVYSEADLAATSAWWVLDALPDPDEFLAKLGL